MREHGLAIDSLHSTEVVTADGAQHRVTEDKDEKPKKDLFWALCGGGGGNFGINTSFTFRTFVVPFRVTVFSLKWYGEDCIRAFLAFQEIVRAAPDTLGTIAHFGAELEPSGTVRPYLRVFGQVVESKDAVNLLLAPVIAAVKPRETEVEEMTFWAAKSWLGGGKSPPAPNGFLERSRFHPRPLTERAVAAIVTALARAPIQNSHHSVSSSFFAWGGKVARRSPDATAFVHRKDVWLQSFDCSWGTDAGPAMDPLLAWLNRLYDEMGAHSSDRCYVNFADPQLHRPLPAYYGDNLPGLIEVKKKYDPHNVFNFAQSIHG
jgi:FAD/FMN-containing dehydrogenase